MGKGAGRKESKRATQKPAAWGDSEEQEKSRASPQRPGPHGGIRGPKSGQRLPLLGSTRRRRQGARGTPWCGLSRRAQRPASPLPSCPGLGPPWSAPRAPCRGRAPRPRIRRGPQPPLSLSFTPFPSGTLAAACGGRASSRPGLASGSGRPGTPAPLSLRREWHLPTDTGRGPRNSPLPHFFLLGDFHPTFWCLFC